MGMGKVPRKLEKLDSNHVIGGHVDIYTLIEKRGKIRGQTTLKYQLQKCQRYIIIDNSQTVLLSG